jgi:hypothetical protein
MIKTIMADLDFETVTVDGPGLERARRRARRPGAATPTIMRFKFDL